MKDFKQVLSASSKIETNAGTKLEDLPIFPSDLDEYVRRLNNSECKTTILRDIAARRYNLEECKLGSCSSFSSYKWKLKLWGQQQLVGGFHAEISDTQSVFSNLTSLINQTIKEFVPSTTIRESQAPSVILAGAEIVIDLN
jgi:hypothetical protein